MNGHLGYLFGGRAASRRRRGARASSLRRIESFGRVEALEIRTLLSSNIPLSGLTWTPIGPAPIGDGVAGDNASGRITGIAADPNDPNTLYIAAAGGGAWKTTDGGTTWAPLTDNQATLASGAIAIAPSNPNTLYLGTGESDYTTDSLYGRGILASNDAGASWTLEGSSVFNRSGIAKIAVDPADPATFYVAVAVAGPGERTGIFKTSDGGANFADTTPGISTTDAFTDLVIDPNNGQDLYAAAGYPFGGDPANGVYKSTDGGATWAPAGNFPQGASNGRISLAISASNPDVLVAAVADPFSLSIRSIYRSTDGGITWKSTVTPPDYLNGTGWYANAIAISPADPNTIFAGGTLGTGAASNPSNGLIESNDGGNTWYSLVPGTNNVTPNTYAHAFAFDADGHLLDGNDGGIWRLDVATKRTHDWSNLNGNLQITEFTAAALDPSNPNIVYGGSQSTGTEKFNDSLGWSQVRGGDGGYVRVDPTNPQTVYHTYAGSVSTLERSDDGGKTWTDVSQGIVGTGDFYPFYTLDPTTPSTILYGTDQVNVSFDRGNTWTTISAPGTNGWGADEPIDAIAVAPTDSNTIYASTGNHLYVTTDFGGTWTPIDVSGAAGSYASLLVDANSPQTAYVVRNTFTGSGAGHIFQTTDGGAEWQDVSGNLPDVPVNALAIDTRPGLAAIYAGTDTGVYASFDGGVNWAPYRSGLPNVQVVSLELNTDLNILLAATHGRGAFEIIPTGQLVVQATAPAGVQVEVPIDGAQVATFVAAAGVPLGNFTATITWGDGTTSDGVVQLVGGGPTDSTATYQVLGSHTYTLGGTYTLGVSVTQVGGEQGSDSTSLVVQADPIVVTPVDITGEEGHTFTGIVGTLFDTDPRASAAGAYTVTVAWADGSSTAGTLTPVAGQFNTYTIATSKFFPEEGTSQFAITATSTGQATDTETGTVTVDDAPLDPGPTVSISPTEGTLFSGTVASFVDEDPFAPLTDFTATIDWGDGHVVPGLILRDPNQTGGFLILGSNRYVNVGSYTGTITINDVGGSHLAASLDVAVQDASLTAQGTSFGVVEGQTFNGTVATFQSGDPIAPISDFSATIDWGDGTAPDANATIISTGAGQFQVQASHVFSAGIYAGTVTINDVGGKNATASVAAIVSDAAISLSTVGLASPTVVEGSPLTAFVATLTDADPYASAATYSVVTIDWGDGTQSNLGDAKNPPVLTQPAGAAPGTFVISDTHTYTHFGTYAVTTTVHDSGGSQATTSLTATATFAPIVASGVGTVVGQEGVAYTSPLAIFYDSNPTPTLSDFTATIDWGDGTTTAGSIIPNPDGDGSFVVNGNHAYTSPSVGYTVSVTIHDAGGQSKTVTSQVAIPDAQLTPEVVPITGLVEGNQFNVVVGQFLDADPNPNLATLSAAIDWGDNTAATAGVILFDDGVYDVRGSHVYPAAGQYTVTVTVASAGGASTSIVSTAVVGSAALTAATATPITLTRGIAYTGPTMTFTSADPIAGASDFTFAQIDWGDGAVTNGTVAPAGGGKFTVSGDHTYDQVGTFSIATTVVSRSNAVANSTTTATVQDAALVATAGSAFTSKVGQPVSPTLASISYGDPTSTPADITATVAWGDGTSSAGTVVADPVNGAGHFLVLGTHAYQAVGSFTATVSLSDSGGNSAVATVAATVGDAAILVTAEPIATVAGSTITAQVATFTSANPIATASTFSASINWGDGTVTAGTVAPITPGLYSVTGTHTYAVAGTDTTLITVTSAGGSSATASQTVTVAVRTVQISGGLDPAANTGGETGNGVVITRYAQPIFAGTGGPGDTLTLTGQRPDMASPLVIAQAIIGADGTWRVASVPLVDGTYTVVATTADAQGNSTSPAVTFPKLEVDVVGPRITGVTLNPKLGQATIAIQDGFTGLAESALANPANYSLGLSTTKGVQGVTLNNVSVSSGGPTDIRYVTLSFASNTGRKHGKLGVLAAGKYILSVNGANLTDAAGNPLNVYIYTPPSTPKPGSAYLAQFVTNGQATSTPQVVQVSTGAKPKPTRFHRTRK